MIYSRFGGEVTIVRMATIEDVRSFENRKPDKEDRSRTVEGMRVIAARWDGTEFLADVAYLKADGGWREIDAAIRKVRPRP